VARAGATGVRDGLLIGVVRLDNKGSSPPQIKTLLVGPRIRRRCLAAPAARTHSYPASHNPEGGTVAGVMLMDALAIGAADMRALIASERPRDAQECAK
jgi:hypothetical protein